MPLLPLCMCLCVDVCIYVCMYVCMYACMPMYVLFYVLYMYTSFSARVFCSPACRYVTIVPVCWFAFMCVCVCPLYVCVYVRLPAGLPVCMYV